MSVFFYKTYYGIFKEIHNCNKDYIDKLTNCFLIGILKLWSNLCKMN